MVLVYADRDELQILDVFFEAQIEEMSLKLFRRRLSAEGAKPESNNRWKMGSGHVCILYVCLYVFMYVFRKYLAISSTERVQSGTIR